MCNSQKKVLTRAKVNPDIIWERLKAIAKDKQFGTLKCEVVIHAGRITEVRHQEFIGVIRA